MTTKPSELAPFVSDGCTIYGFLHEWWYGVKPPFQDTLCKKHDKEYWEGGNFWDKLRSDLNLADGLLTIGYWKSAIWVTFFLLVLSPVLPLMPVRNWRWGGGRPWPQWYKTHKLPEG